ncbi:hypothetical protein EJB05_52258, partial [Eragrostis curvula]
MDSDERLREASDMDDGDRISSLPDDLLLSILVRLRSTPAAARTSLLSRRWRHLWTQLREVVLENLHSSATVTAALAQLAADANTAPPEFSRLAITFRHQELRYPDTAIPVPTMSSLREDNLKNGIRGHVISEKSAFMSPE